MATRAMLAYHDNQGLALIYSHTGNDPVDLTAIIQELIAAHSPSILPALVGLKPLPNTNTTATGWSYLDRDTPDLSHLPDDYDVQEYLEDLDSEEFTQSQLRARTLLVANGNTAATGRHRIIAGVGVLALGDDDTRTRLSEVDGAAIEAVGDQANGEVLMLTYSGEVLALTTAARLHRRLEAGAPPATLVGDQGGRSAVTGEAGRSSASPDTIRLETEHGALYLPPEEVLTVAWD